eukprot:2789577-Rhodomonas_salina.1
MHRDITKLPMSDDMLRLFAGPALLGWGLGKYVAAKSGAAAEYCSTGARSAESFVHVLPSGRLSIAFASLFRTSTQENS